MLGSEDPPGTDWFRRCAHGPGLCQAPTEFGWVHRQDRGWSGAAAADLKRLHSLTTRVSAGAINLLKEFQACVVSSEIRQVHMPTINMSNVSWKTIEVRVWTCSHLAHFNQQDLTLKLPAMARIATLEDVICKQCHYPTKRWGLKLQESESYPDIIYADYFGSWSLIYVCKCIDYTYLYIHTNIYVIYNC